MVESEMRDIREVESGIINMSRVEIWTRTRMKLFFKRIDYKWMSGGVNNKIGFSKWSGNVMMDNIWDSKASFSLYEKIRML